MYVDSYFPVDFAPSGKELGITKSSTIWLHLTSICRGQIQCPMYPQSQRQVMNLKKLFTSFNLKLSPFYSLQFCCNMNQTIKEILEQKKKRVNRRESLKRGLYLLSSEFLLDLYCNVSRTLMFKQTNLDPVKIRPCFHLSQVRIKTMHITSTFHF